MYYFRLGIATPKKDFVNKTWSDENLNAALEALRNKKISANKASKLFGIPSSVRPNVVFKLKMKLIKLKIKLYKLKIKLYKLKIKLFKLKIELFKLKIELFKLKIELFKLKMSIKGL